MLEYEDDDHTVIDIESFNCTTTTISERVVIQPEILKYYEEGGASLESYEQAVTLTPAEDKFYSQMKELNELKLFSNNCIPCVEELGATYEAGMVGAALGGKFNHTSELKVTQYEESMKTPEKTILGGFCGH